MNTTAYFKDQVSSNYFEVRNEISLKIGENDFRSFSTYDIFMKKTPNENYDLLVDRLKFKVNGEEIQNKFSKVSDHYFKCIFPIKFSIGDELKVANYEEITLRINEKDQQLQDEMQGEGLQYIRGQFIESTNTPEKLEQLILSLGIVKIINLSFQRYSPEETISFEWMTPIIGKTFWKKNENGVAENQSYSYENSNYDSLKNFFNQYRVKNKLEEINTDVAIKSSLEHKINYLNDSFFFTGSITAVNVEIENYFDYKETIILKSMLE